MSKIIQRGAASAMRMRSMSSGPLTPEKMTEFAHKINPAQTSFGPKSATVEKWQKHFQDPLNAEIPIYRRKGASDDIIVACIGISVFSLFAANVYDFFAN